MNSRATIFLLILTLLAVAGVFYLRHAVPPTREAQENRRYAAVFDPEAVKEIDITRADGKISLRKEAGGWKLTAPIQDRASPEAVDRLLTAARFMEVRDRQPGRDAKNFPETALVPPRFRIEMRGEEGATLDIGAATALPKEVFVRVDGQPGVMRAADTIVEVADAAPEAFRDPRLTEFTSDDIEKFTVRRADGEMTLRRERGRWMIEKPVQAAADPQAVRAFLDPILGLRITLFGVSTENPAATLPAQEAAISITPRGGSDDLELRLEGEDSRKPETLTAFFKPRGGSLVVDGSASSLFTVSPEQLRDRSLGYVDIDTVDRIVLESEGKKVTLQRDGDIWTDGDKQKRSAADIEKLVGTFNGTKVGAFRTAESAEAVGLAAPSQKIVFYAWLSENTAEDSSGGHVIAGAELGHAAPNGGFHARASGSEETVTVPAELSQAIRAAASAPNATSSPR